jgi:hypothetical protein
LRSLFKSGIKQQFRGLSAFQEHTMDPDTPATNPDDLLRPDTPDEAKKLGEHGQIGNQQDPSKDQNNSAQQIQAQQGQTNGGDGKMDISQQDEETDFEVDLDDEDDDDDDGEDLFSDEASNDPAQKHKLMDGGPTDASV